MATAYANKDDATTLCRECAMDARMGGAHVVHFTMTQAMDCDYCHEPIGGGDATR